MAVGDVIQTTIGCRFNEQIGLNVRHYESVASTGGGISSLGLLANALATRFGGLYAVLMSSSAEFRGVICQRIRPLPPTMPIISNIATVVGAVGADPLPRQVSGLISLRTNFAGRAFRGRAYIPFPAETDSGGDATPTPVYLSALTALAAAMLEPVGITDGGSTESFLPVVYHRADRTTSYITSAIVHDNWATQRRRGSFGRPNALLGTEVPIVPVAP